MSYLLLTYVGYEGDVNEAPSVACALDADDLVIEVLGEHPTAEALRESLTAGQLSATDVLVMHSRWEVERVDALPPGLWM